MLHKAVGRVHTVGLYSVPDLSIPSAVRPVQKQLQETQL